MNSDFERAIPSPEVEQTIVMPARYQRPAMERMAEFFRRRGQLREIYHANGQWHLHVTFKGRWQAEAFRQALLGGEFGKS